MGLDISHTIAELAHQAPPSSCSSKYVADEKLPAPGASGTSISWKIDFKRTAKIARLDAWNGDSQKIAAGNSW